MIKSDLLFKKRFRISTTRLQSWDYSSSGYYFITICAYQKKEYFGKIHYRKMELSIMGKIAQTYWKEIPKHFPFVTLDEFVVMPNHVHGIIIITSHKCRDAKFCVSTKSHHHASKNTFGPQSQNLGSIIRGYKSAITKYATINAIPFHWQSRYYDHIIRSENEIHSIREYIRYNPLKWDDDEENPANGS